MKAAILSLLLSIIFASIGFTHGVERGDKFNHLLDSRIQKRIFGSIERACDLREAASLEITDVVVTHKIVDQNIKDYFYTITLSAIMPAHIGGEQLITVKAAEYAISNPDIDPYEIISVKSQICD